MAKFLSVLKDALFTPGPVVVGENEIVPGVEKPTVILTNMVATEALKDPKSADKRSEYSRDWETQKIFEFKTDKMFASFYLRRKTESHKFETAEHQIGFIRKVRDETYQHNTFYKDEVQHIALESELEKNTLEKAIYEALRLKDAILAQEAENAKQDNAMKLIEEFFTAPKTEPKPKRVAKPKAPKLVANPLKTGNNRSKF